MSAAVPKKLGKYEIVRAVGQGAMGVVYEGFDPVIERTVAIKTIRKDELDAAEAEEHSRRFLIEARAAGKLNHPHIVGIYDYGDEQGLAYIVMEFVKGKELKSYFDAKHAFSTAHTVRLMSELLDALGYSHSRGVIHRDIKPANIFVTEAGVVKLGDFGIARIDSSQKTHAGTVLGTPSYMSPEQIRGETADPRSDLYSAGVILYQFLVGERPFTGNMVVVMQKVLNEPPLPPSARNPAISPAVDAVVLRALAKDTGTRFQNAAEFSQALASAVGFGGDSDDDSEATMVVAPKALRRTPSPGDRNEATATRGSVISTSGIGGAVATGANASATTGSLQELRSRREKLDEELRLAEEAQRQFEEAQHEWETLASTADGLLARCRQRQQAALSLLVDPALLVDGEALAAELAQELDLAQRTGSQIDQFAMQATALAPAERDRAQGQAKALNDAVLHLKDARQRLESERLKRREDVLARVSALDSRCLEVQGACNQRAKRLADLSGLEVERGLEQVSVLSREADQLRDDSQALQSLPLKMPADVADRIAALKSNADRVHRDVQALLHRAEAAATQARREAEQTLSQWTAMAAEAERVLVQCKQRQQAMQTMLVDVSLLVNGAALEVSLTHDAELAQRTGAQIDQFLPQASALAPAQRERAQAQVRALADARRQLEGDRQRLESERVQRREALVGKCQAIDSLCLGLRTSLDRHQVLVARLGSGGSVQDVDAARAQASGLVSDADRLKGDALALQRQPLQLPADLAQPIAAACALAEDLQREAQALLPQVEAAAVSARVATQTQRQADDALAQWTKLEASAEGLLAQCRQRQKAVLALLTDAAILLTGPALEAELQRDGDEAQRASAQTTQFLQQTAALAPAQRTRAQGQAKALADAGAQLQQAHQRLAAERGRLGDELTGQWQALESRSKALKSALDQRDAWLAKLGPAASLAEFESGLALLSDLAQDARRHAGDAKTLQSQPVKLPAELARRADEALGLAERLHRDLQAQLNRAEMATAQAREKQAAEHKRAQAEARRQREQTLGSALPAPPPVEEGASAPDDDATIIAKPQGKATPAAVPPALVSATGVSPPVQPTAVLPSSVPKPPVQPPAVATALASAQPVAQPAVARTAVSAPAGGPSPVVAAPASESPAAGGKQMLLPVAGAAVVVAAGALWFMLKPSMPLTPPPTAPTVNLPSSPPPTVKVEPVAGAGEVAPPAKPPIGGDVVVSDKAAKEQAAKEQAAKEASAKEAAAKDAATKAAAAKSAVGKDNAALDQAAKDKAARDAVVNAAKKEAEDAVRKEAAAKEVASKEAAAREAAARDAAAKEKERIAKEAVGKEAAAREVAAKEAAARDVAAKEAAARDVAAKEAAKAAATPTRAPADLYQQGLSLNNREGVKLLEQAGHAGHGPASKKLMEIYNAGGMGVGKDYTKAVQWKNRAQSQGQNVNE